MKLRFKKQVALSDDPNYEISSGEWNSQDLLELVEKIKNADIDSAAAISESKLALNFPTHQEEEMDITINYKITDLDISGDIKYFGYTDEDGNWYIMKLTNAESRYIKGSSDYITNWAGRTGLSYDYFYNIF